MQLNNETKIGVLVVLVLGILGVLTWKAGNYDFRAQGYHVKVQFSNIEGVDKNAPVTVNGFEVGRVQDIQIVYGEKTYVELVLYLDTKAKIHKGATAFIKQMGFLGEKFVGLTTGDDAQEFLGDGAVIQGTEPASLEKLLREGQEIATNIKEISVQVNERLRVNSEAIDAIFADLRASMNNISVISGNVKERLEVNDLLIDGIVGNLNSTSKNLEEMSFDLKQNPWKLLYKPKKNE